MLRLCGIYVKSELDKLYLISYNQVVGLCFFEEKNQEWCIQKAEIVHLYLDIKFIECWTFKSVWRISL